jgi:NAD(P)-dependent dehydrogenase (short-subunit alcohol dehydrogenase family)
MIMAAIKHEKDSNVPPTKIYPDKFSGQVVIVTGAGSGIGETTARLFAQQGAQVVLFDIDEQKARNVENSIQQATGKASFEPCNISDEQSVSEALKATIAKHQKIDVLVNIAGIYPFHALKDYPTYVYRQIMSVNLDGSFFLTRAVLPYMQEAGYGRIIHTSSSTFSDPQFGLVPYIASKAGVIGLARASAAEAGPGVTVNVVLPGLTETAGVASSSESKALFDEIMAKQFVKRRGHPLDLAHTFCFIASPEASFITGQMFDVAGGETCH